MGIRIWSILFQLSAFVALTNAQTNDSTSSITIGWQVWMAKNMDVDHFANGDLIPFVRDRLYWKDASDRGIPAWCYYNNDPSNGEKYGKLYNWWAVHDPRGLAPKGWHIPSDLEWSLITSHLGGEAVAGSALKSTFGWDNNKEGANGNGTSSSRGFVGLPGGNRVNNGNFSLIGKVGGWWTTNQAGYAVACLHFLYNEDDQDHKDSNVKGCGFSVRCIKD